MRESRGLRGMRFGAPKRSKSPPLSVDLVVRGPDYPEAPPTPTPPPLAVSPSEVEDALTARARRAASAKPPCGNTSRCLTARAIISLAIALLVLLTFVFSFVSAAVSRDSRKKIWWERLQLADPSAASVRPLNESEYAKSCRNTRQGRYEVADDQGYLCPREHLDPDRLGCCKTLVPAPPDDPEQQAPTSGVPASPSEPGRLVKTPRYTCGACDMAMSCCSTYEACVSCCMGPLAGPARQGFVSCTALCRTSSRSVVRQRFYKYPSKKFCFVM
eukprot:m51a1_g14026 hypothetical protein (273) ;mRNA; r:1119558-1120480